METVEEIEDKSTYQQYDKGRTHKYIGLF